MTAGRHVFLSPHPDDAVWSCGWLLLRLLKGGENVFVVTIFDGDAPDVPATGWRRIASPQLRRRENDHALRTIGAAGLSLGMVDAALRAGEGGYRYEDPAALLGRLPSIDGELVTLLATRLQIVLRPVDKVYAPLAGPGSHVDHRIARLAADCAATGVLSYYREFPYSHPATTAPERPAAGEGAEWIDLACRYRSQVLGLFGQRKCFVESLRRWAEAGAGLELSGRMRRGG